MNDTRLHPLTIMGISACFPLLIALFASSDRMMFCTVFALMTLLLLHQYRKALIAGSIIATFLFVYMLCIYYFPHPLLVTFLRMCYMFSPCGLMAIGLFSSYNSAELFAALEKARLPKTLVIALSLTLRYIPTFIREFRIIREAMLTRGVKASWCHPIRTFEYYLVPQLFRCLALSVELTSASLCRGVRSQACRVRYFDTPLRMIDYAAALFFFVGFLLI